MTAPNQPLERAPALALSDLLCPLIVVSPRGLLLFRSAGSLEVRLGASGVAAGRYGPAFDAEGRLLAIEAAGDGGSRSRWRRIAGRRRAPGFVEVAIREPEPGHRYRLKRELERALGVEPHSGAELFDLVVEVIGRYGLI
jgi:hypothetical protein